MGMLTKFRPSAGGTTGAPKAEATTGVETTETATAETPAAKAPTRRRPPWEVLLRRQKDEKEASTLKGTFDAYPHLRAIKPKERYTFRSDYFDVDGSVACILSFFHKDEANDGFAPFWGVARIPDGLDKSVTTIVLESVEKKEDAWVEAKLKDSERMEKLDANEQRQSGGTSKTRKKSAKIAGDRDTIVTELQNGAAYLSVHNRLLVKAPTLEILDKSLATIERLYVDRFATIRAEAYVGEQRRELTTLMRSHEKKRGKGFHYTSTEFAGSYSLVTNGLNDSDGEYVGYMLGDVNNSATIFDANDYGHHVVVADEAVSPYLGREKVANMWCSKLGQTALLDNASVVHIVLDEANLDKLGPRFDGITSRVNLDSGDVNMFEMFGDSSDELSIYAAQMQKITLMFEQLYESEDASVGSIIRSALESMATQFYVDQGMWVHNAKENRHRLRVVGIPHEQVPLLHMFRAYLDTRLKSLRASSASDQDQIRAYNVLTGVTENLLSTNGDLFNNTTAAAIDGVRDSKRVVYNFADLMRRGEGVAMAQLVNIIGFAIGKLGLGDVVVIHGTENIDDGVKKYIDTQFKQLFQRGGRVVYSYNDIDEMLSDTKFNRFDAADYTLLGPMRQPTIEKYQELLHKKLPSKLLTELSARDPKKPRTFLRRDMTNVVFHLDLALGINPGREKQRREMAMAAVDAAEKAKYEALMVGPGPTPGANTTGYGEGNDQRALAQAEAAKAAKLSRKKKTPPGQSEAETGPKSLKKKTRGKRGEDQ